MKSYVRRCRNLLTGRSRAVRIEKYPKLLSRLKNKGGDNRIFVDEKKLIVNEVAIRQNTRVFACHPSDASPVRQNKNPASAMVLAAVASDGQVMPP